MPKQTFFNLPEDKQRLIEEAAVEEFAERGYEAASITQMVSRAGIAKGSFYQYFEDKHDLFMHLVNRVMEEKRTYFKDRQPPAPGMDVFASLRWMFEAGFAYAATQSRLNQAVSRVLFGEGLFMGDMFKEARHASAQMFIEMFQRAAEHGDIDVNIDPSVAAFVVETLLNSLGLFILSQQAVGQEVLQQGRIDWLTSERAHQIVDNMLLVLEHGLRKKADS